MTDPAARSRTGADADGESPPRAPRWVKVAAIVVAVLILVFLLLQLTGIGGEHGPGRHMSGEGTVSGGVTGGQATSPAPVRW